MYQYIYTDLIKKLRIQRIKKEEESISSLIKYHDSEKPWMRRTRGTCPFSAMCIDIPLAWILPCFMSLVIFYFYFTIPVFVASSIDVNTDNEYSTLVTYIYAENSTLLTCAEMQSENGPGPSF